MVPCWGSSRSLEILSVLFRGVVTSILAVSISIGLGTLYAGTALGEEMRGMGRLGREDKGEDSDMVDSNGEYLLTRGVVGNKRGGGFRRDNPLENPVKAPDLGV